MIIRARAPLRLGLAGGGTDVSPYSDLYGGCILNATINLFAYATIEPRGDGLIRLEAIDRGEVFEARCTDEPLPLDGCLDLHKGIYNRILRQFFARGLSFTLTTAVDAPAGSGLGSSSTLVTTILGAFAEWLGLPLGDYDTARMAYEIERLDLGMAGGKQDQYAAAFGGFNFMEFMEGDKVIVNPLRIRPEYLRELESCLLVFYTGRSRLSAQIIESQIQSVDRKDVDSIHAMHALKAQAVQMKEALLMGRLQKIGEILHYGWENKKRMAQGISNPHMDQIYEAALQAGATGGKLSGAGGGGHFLFFAPGLSRYRVIKALEPLGGTFRSLQFTEHGLMTWRAS